MMLGRLPLLLLLAVPVFSQTPCDGTPAYSPCEIVFDLSAPDLAAHPNPYVSAQLRAEFRSPHFKTYLMPAFWDGGRRLIIRFTPSEAGQWTYRTTSNIAAFDAKEAAFNAAGSASPGYINAANFHHWATDDKKPHLWMGYVADRFPFSTQPEFEQQLADAAQNKFTHFRGSILGAAADRGRVYLAADKPNPAYFDEL
ncbi:MAG TPA: DUF5060 domain-containing protein, partial [Bryobacteraceae bacterium]|nr:DUF5060 domain-containing protein [Bryobacteraceae bacterium]